MGPVGLCTCDESCMFVHMCVKVLRILSVEKLHIYMLVCAFVCARVLQCKTSFVMMVIGSLWGIRTAACLSRQRLTGGQREEERALDTCGFAPLFQESRPLLSLVCLALSAIISSPHPQFSTLLVFFLFLFEENNQQFTVVLSLGGLVEKMRGEEEWRKGEGKKG